jgi:diguanylate cyclase (GGDEF)-like protein
VTGRITLGLLIDQLVTGYARLLVSGVEDWCAAQDANLIIYSGEVLRSLKGYEYQSNVIFDYIRKNTIDALVMASGTQTRHMSPDEFRLYADRFEGIPKVSIGVCLDGIPSVLVDNRAGVLAAVEHLAVTHGLNRIAFLAGPDTNSEARARLEAYGEAVILHHLDDDPSLVIAGDFTEEGARSALTSYLELKGQPDFKALVAANDEMANAAGQVLSEHGYAVPREIAIVGFDNIVTSQFMVPPLTTVDQSVHDQGWTAAAFAARLVRGESVPSVVVLPPRLVLRTSCGCLPRAVVDLAGLSPLGVGGREQAGVEVIVDRCLVRFAENGVALPEQAPRELLRSLVTCADTDDFLRLYYDALVEEIRRGVDVAGWHALLIVLQEELVRRAGTQEEVGSLWARFQKARVLLAELQAIQQGRRWTGLLANLRSLRLVMERLVSVASIGDLMNDLADELSRIDIGTCFIASYSGEITHRRDHAWVIPDRGEMMLALVGGKRITLRPEEKVFSPAAHLVPPSLLPGARRYRLVAAAMFFREDQIGYILFEPGSRDSAIYDAFCVQLSSILEGARLLTARQKAEERLRQVLSELEEYNLKLSGISQTDELTGLYNRRGFLSVGVQSLALARRMGRPGNVFFADLDGLKKINDSYGHQEGDAAIRQAAKLLSATFRHMDIIARLGGDEFTVLAVDTGPGFCAILGKRLEADLDGYNAQSKKPYRLSMSIGAVPFDAGSTLSLAELLGQADETLYAEKKRKKRITE